MDKMIHTIAIRSFRLIRCAWADKASMIGRTLRAHWQREDGQDMVEYALLLGFVALAGVSLLSGIRTSISSIWSQISDSLTTGAS
jgi:Flp pilus assembly pilin Flp